MTECHCEAPPILTDIEVVVSTVAVVFEVVLEDQRQNLKLGRLQ